MSAKTNWKLSDVEYLRQNYFYKSYEEIAANLGMSATVVSRKARELKLPPKTEYYRIQYEYGDVGTLLQRLHIEEKLSVNQMSIKLNVSRNSINRWMEQYGIQWRNQSEAEKLKWEQMTEEQRQAQVEAAHEKGRELVKQGKHSFQIWRQKNPEVAVEHSRKVARLGSIERERRGTNWMKGKTGPLHHNWKGGKNEYHRLRSLALGNWWVNRRKALKRDNNTCQKCGAHGRGVLIHVHHIVSLRNGGNNSLDNLICYCHVCHKTEEWETSRRLSS